MMARRDNATRPREGFYGMTSWWNCPAARRPIRSGFGGMRRMDWRKQQQAIPEISEAIARGLAMPVQRHPVAEGRAARPQYNVLGQFLATAVNTLARAAQVAPGLVGSVQDVRDLIAYHLGHDAGAVPALAQGWRAEVVGQYVGRLLDGELAIRIVDPHAPHEPLAFEPMGETSNERRGASLSGGRVAGPLARSREHSLPPAAKCPRPNARGQMPAAKCPRSQMPAGQ